MLVSMSVVDSYIAESWNVYYCTECIINGERVFDVNGNGKMLFLPVGA